MNPRHRCACAYSVVGFLPVAVVWCVGVFPLGAAEQADFVLTGGRIVTLDARGTIATAIAVRNERIIHVGSDEAAMAMVGPNTTVYAAAGRTVIPGLNETHAHPTLAARSECTLPFRQLGSIEEIQSWVRDRVAETPEA